MRELKGKYLTAAQDFVSSVQLGSDRPIPAEPAVQRFIESVHSQHKDSLTTDDAFRLIFEITYNFLPVADNRSGRLGDDANKDLADALLVRLKSALEGLPYKYSMRIELPQFPAWGEAVAEITDFVRMHIGQKSKPIKLRDFLNYAGSQAPTTDDLAAYLEIDLAGYADESGQSPAVADAVSAAKCTAFLLNAHGLVTDSFERGRARTLLHCYHDGTTSAVWVPDSLRNCFGNLMFKESTLRVLEFSGRSLLDHSEREPNSDEERIAEFKKNVKRISELLACSRHGKYSSIYAAIDWYQDSMLADNQTVAYLSACIGLESILGADEHMSNMTDRLADRYAFLLGKDRGTRAALGKQYRDVLQLRGKLVHAKARRLAPDQAALLDTARQILYRVIAHELENVSDMEATASGQPTRLLRRRR